MYLNGIAVLLGALVTPVALSLAGCELEPLTRETFCQKWGRAACTSEVVSVCQTATSDCQASQATSCRDWLPDDFQDVGVDECLNAVSDAYSDADLDAAELDVVWRLRGPCSGIVAAGESGETCESDADCNGYSGLTCALRDRATGTCERVEPVDAGFSCEEAQQVCETGFYCNGENCIVAAEVDERCENDSQCAAGLFCPDERCAAQLPVGTDCSSDRQCESAICYEIDVNERVCVDRIRLSPAEPACDTLK